MDNPLVLRVAILIVSDTASVEPSADRSGAILHDVFTGSGSVKWNVAFTRIVPDQTASIRDLVTQWSDIGQDELVNLIITTGGTGFATKDVTPEAIEPLLQKKAPGLVHAMLARSLEITPFAMMSRLVAGVRNKTLIVTVPGSPKGARENLEAIVKLLPHACMQAAGMDSRALHAGGVKKLEMEAGVSPALWKDHQHDHIRNSSGHLHSHNHSHGHSVPRAHTQPEDRPQSNDPSAGPSRRYRESPYPMLSVDAAIRKIIQNTPAPRVISRRVDTSLVGYVLAEDVTATEAVPAFRASTVDGYAVIISKDSGSIKGTFPVALVSHASAGQIPPLRIRQIARITTGAPLPPGATSVVMVEDTVLRSMTPDGKEESTVEILTDRIMPNENVREIGSDIPAGEVVLRKGERVSAVGGELGILASVGRAEVSVYERPITGVLSTGDEIIPHDRPGTLRLGEVRDCNKLTIMAAIRGWGYEVVDLGIVADTPEALEEAIRLSFRRCSVLITTGGVSMGELDLLKPTLERSLGATIHFGRVALQPGKPATFATVPYKNTSGDTEPRLAFGLPGNPASAAVTAALFVMPSLKAAAGEMESTRTAMKDSSGTEPMSATASNNAGLPRVRVLLAESVHYENSREEYRRAIVRMSESGRLVASTTGEQRSSRVGSFRNANALLVLPAGGGSLSKGSEVGAVLLGEIQWDGASG